MKSNVLKKEYTAMDYLGYALYAFGGLGLEIYPNKLFPDFSTVNFNVFDQAIAIFPSIFNMSLSNSNSINSSLGTGLSKIATPWTSKHRLNRLFVSYSIQNAND